MSRQRAREDFITRCAKRGIPVEAARKFLRYARTLHRLAEAQCNGDWPADNGERLVNPCTECEGLWAPSVLLKGKRCPDCRTERLARQLCSYLDGAVMQGFEARFRGDPRGSVLQLRIPGDPGDYGDGFVRVP